MLAAILFTIAGLQTEPSFFDIIPKGTVVWVGAHSDDESLVAGALLSEFTRRGYHVVVLTMTEGSSSGYEGGEYNAQLALTRRTESMDACKFYEAQGCLTLMFPELAHYVDVPGGAWKESAQEILERWRAMGMVRDLAALIDALHPVVLITLDPDHGMYGHPEHMAVARAVTEIAAEKDLQVYAAENRFASIVGDNIDPGPVTWEIPGADRCGTQSCWEVGYEAVQAYASQKLPRLDLVPVHEQATFLRALSRRHHAAQQ